MLNTKEDIWKKMVTKQLMVALTYIVFKIKKLIILFSKDALKYSKNTENVYVTKYLYFK